MSLIICQYFSNIRYHFIIALLKALSCILLNQIPLGHLLFLILCVQSRVNTIICRKYSLTME